MRRLVQPGPVSVERIESFRGRCEFFDFTLEPGLTLADAVSRPLIEMGVSAAVLRLADAGLEPLRYVIPAPAAGPDHVAYYSAPRAPAGRCWLELANMTFGYSGGTPRLHCHATWMEFDGGYRGGHILLEETIVTTPTSISAWAFRDLEIGAKLDVETNFTLLKPTRVREAPGGQGILARILPNQDLCGAIETIAERHGMRDAVVRSSLGSLIGGRFFDGRDVVDVATEVLVRSGEVRNGIAALDVSLVDMQGAVHTGRLVRGDNPVCITFDVVLEEVAAAAGPDRL